MRRVLCDFESFHPFTRLVEGPFEPDALPSLERLLRALVLHDEIVLKREMRVTVPENSDPECQLASPEVNGYGLLVALAPKIVHIPNGRELLRKAIEGTESFVAKTEVKIAEQDLNRYIEHLAPVMFDAGLLASFLDAGGSVLVSGSASSGFEDKARETPEKLFGHLDSSWQDFARKGVDDGFGLLVPPVTGIVLTRCARRDAIPAVAADLRVEWAGARRKVWELLDTLKTCRTLAEALQIKAELAEASKLFAPEKSELDSRPVRVFWDITAGLELGVVVAAMSGGNLSLAPLPAASVRQLDPCQRCYTTWAHRCSGEELSTLRGASGVGCPQMSERPFDGCFPKPS